MASVKWNDNVKLIVSDVDETIAGVYMDAEPGMIKELEKVLEENKAIFMVTGHGLKGVQKRITDKISKRLRRRILIAHCSGAEVQGFDGEGNVLEKPYYDKYETVFSEKQKKKWRKVVQQIISEFGLKTYPTMPEHVFVEKSGGDPLSIMVDDRGPQITFEVVNAIELSEEQVKKLGIRVPKTDGHYDLRIPISRRAQELFDGNKLPITARLAGVFAIDFAIRNVSKTLAVKYVIEKEQVLSRLGLPGNIEETPGCIEVWGDKFSVIRGGTDRHISEALPKAVRSITFRKENPVEFPEGYNIVVWDGKQHLHHGLLEFLKSRRV